MWSQVTFVHFTVYFLIASTRSSSTIVRTPSRNSRNIVTLFPCLFVKASTTIRSCDTHLHLVTPPVEPTVTVMKADSHLQVDPSTVCHRCEKCFRSSGTRVDRKSCVVRRSMQTLRARVRSLDRPPTPTHR